VGVKERLRIPVVVGKKLLGENDNIKFFLSFDHFNTKPIFSDIDEYGVYKKCAMSFVKAGNKRIENYAYANNLQ
jgi:hypothetical protein